MSWKDVLHPAEVEGDDVARSEIATDQRVGLLRDALGGAVRVPVSDERIVGSGISWTLAQTILVACSLRHDRPSIFATW
jgi:hypothetical protein